MGLLYSPSLPLGFREGKASCLHSPLYLIFNDGDPHCGLCLLMDAIRHELPKKMHYTQRQLTTNGNPQQTAILMAHVQLVEGLKPPRPDESLKQFRLAREQYTKTKPAHQIFPFTSALWELMGYQPTLATPLIKLIYGHEEPQLARLLGISQYELKVRVSKAIKATLKYVRL